MLAVEGRTAHEIFASLDDLKFHSSMTLFAKAPGADACFAAALKRYFDGQLDEMTLKLLTGR